MLLPEHQENPHNALPPTVERICRACALYTMLDDWKVGQQMIQELGQPFSHNHPCLQCDTFANNWLLAVFLDDGMQTLTAC